MKLKVKKTLNIETSITKPCLSFNWSLYWGLIVVQFSKIK